MRENVLNVLCCITFQNTCMLVSLFGWYALLCNTIK